MDDIWIIAAAENSVKSFDVASIYPIEESRSTIIKEDGRQETTQGLVVVEPRNDLMHSSRLYKNLW